MCQILKPSTGVAWIYSKNIAYRQLLYEKIWAEFILMNESISKSVSICMKHSLVQCKLMTLHGFLFLALIHFLWHFNFW